MKKKVKIGFLDFWEGFSLGAFVDRHPYLLKKYELIESDHPDFRFISVFGRRLKEFFVPDKSCINILYTGENVEPDMDTCDYAISFSLNNHPDHYYLPCWVPRLYQNRMLPSDLLSGESSRRNIAGIQHQFCNYIYKNKVGFREDFFSKLNSIRPVMSPGDSCRNMNSIGNTVAEKIDFQRNFKFTIAMENECYPGYITEKIVEAYVARTVPVYMGAPDICDSFNHESFILIEDAGDYDAAIERILYLDRNMNDYLSVRNALVYKDDKVPRYAIEDNIMSFFERIFD